MDKTLINTKKLHRYEYIAELSAASVLEFNVYLQLASAIERYVHELTPENYKIVCDILEQCKSQHARFYQMQKQLVSALVLNNNLRVEPESNQETEIIVDHTTEPVLQPQDVSDPVIITGNVVSLDSFRKKVDKIE